MQDKDAEQEPKYWFSLGPLKFGRSEDTTPIGACGAPVTSPVVLVPPGQTDLSAGVSGQYTAIGRSSLCWKVSLVQFS